MRRSRSSRGRSCRGPSGCSAGAARRPRTRPRRRRSAAPSRASLTPCEYGHNNGVLSNSLPCRSLREKGNVLPVWLRRAGYRTIHVGKFLNGYENVVPPGRPAPGWSDWYTVVGETAYYDYNLYANGRVVHHGTKPADNVTAVLNRIAVRQVAKA